MPEEKKLTSSKILSDFKKAFEYKRKWVKESTEDVEFALGKQWDDDSKQKLLDIGVQPLTINKIRPNVFLLTGMESQNRTDYRAFPKGEEDSLKAEVTTILLKHVMDVSDGEFKQSEQFEEGLMAGECYLEPFLDYTYSLINPELHFKKVSATQIYSSPGFQEYDMSDAKYQCKFSPDLTKDQILELFPEEEKRLDDMPTTKIDVEGWDNLKNALPHHQKTDYAQKNQGTSLAGGFAEEKTYDLLEYYYKKYVKKPLIIDMKLKRMQEAEDEEMAKAYVDTANMTVPGSAMLTSRRVPEIWMAAVIGNDIISDDRAWFYPRWKSWPFIPYFTYRSTAAVKDAELLVQGIARGMKDLNRDYNKRRTQELRHVNQSANSGWQMEEGAVTDEQEENMKKFGGSPGVIIKNKPGKPPPTKIVPSPYPAAHGAMAAERTQEMKESSGINADMLAMQEGQSSGRAILLRQKQGLVMVQKIFDNNSRTKKILGRFILSQLGEVFDVETAMKVIGEDLLLKHFGQPVMQPMIDPMTGGPAVDPMTGQPAMQPVMGPDGKPQLQMIPEAQQAAVEMINRILNDPELAKYDISVGEGIYAETAKAGNYLEIMGMVEKGLPVPPDVIVEESSLNASSKDRIKKYIESQQQQAQAMQAQAALPPQM